MKHIAEINSQKSNETVENNENTDTLLHHLPEDNILLYNIGEEKICPLKPSPTLINFVTDCYITNLPIIPKKVDDIPIPYIREIGVRDAINHLAPFFNCNDFKNNLVQFWFLDIIVDCIWKAQDEYRFTTGQQKCVLEWVLFILDLIGSRNMTKPLMFHIFNEAMMIAEDYVQSGGLEEPVPNKLFSLNLENNADQMMSNENSFHSSSIVDKGFISSSNSQLLTQYVVVQCNDKYQVYKLPTKAGPITCLSSSVDSLSENEFQIKESSNISNNKEESESSIEFYKADMSTPPRFKPLDKLDKPPSVESVLPEDEESLGLDLEWHNIRRKKDAPICPSKTIFENSTLEVIEEKPQENESNLDADTLSSKCSLSDMDPAPIPNEIFKAFYEYNLWKMREEYMNDSKIGWTSFKSKETILEPQKTQPKFNIKAHSSADKNQLFIKSCVLMAVRNMVFDYFEQTFAFELARISLSNPQYYITQDINTQWYIPKDIKGELKKPMPKKPKKEKPIKKEKEKSGKKEKSKEGSKSSKQGKDKKSKKDKKSASDKKSKTDKKSKSSKSDKSKKLNKEEKQEQERLKKEQKELEQQMLREAENMMFMFPLKEAVDEKFFTNLFPNYKPKKAGGTKGDKPSKKSEKSSKSSKKGKKKKK